MTPTNSITVLWYASTGGLSRLIRWITRSPYSHVAIMVGDSVYEALAGGIVRSDGMAAVDRALQAVAVRDLPITAGDQLQVETWLNARVGNRYSKAGFLVAGIAVLTGFRLVLAGPGRFICSGLVATACQIAGYLVASEARLETPASLAEILGTETPPWMDQ